MHIKIFEQLRNVKNHAKRRCYAKKKLKMPAVTPHAKYDTACTIDERFDRSWQPLKGISFKRALARESWA
jgi:hypothetical protein